MAHNSHRVTNDAAEMHARGWRTITAALEEQFVLDCGHVIPREYEGTPYLLRCIACVA